MKEFQIGDRKISPNKIPFIIAEAGINHEGDFKKAIQLVDAAIESGADCIKFQCHITEKEMIPTDMKPGEISDERLWDIIKRCELTEDEEIKIMNYCDKRGILYLCTPFSKEAADRLLAMNVEAFKIGSGECNNIPLIEHIAKMGKPIILSTGMNDLESIKKSVSVIKKENIPLMLMHCTSMYPTPYDKVRLPAIKELYEAFDVPVGLSDHSIGIYTCLGAIPYGACVFEKHFTLTKDWSGPDISISLTPNELSELVKGSMAVFQALNGSKNILPEEKPVIDFAYASVVSIMPIKKGEIFSSKNIWVKRPGTGSFLAYEIDKVLGKKANKNIENNSQIHLTDIE
ncbi:MAG: N-acetylneuraminate synthase family protein [Candidatus Magnetomorum sp.]|nr:N-acetylneuraminate synthase family protein [Candidatus Magnetomorum sp.]